VWKGSNATFIYSVLFKTVETWSRSLIAAIVNVPDPGMIAGLGLNVDVADSPYPWASLGVAVAAAATAGLLLAPLDVVRTKSVPLLCYTISYLLLHRLIMTSTSTPKRSFLHNLRMLPSYTCPPSIVIPTVLHSIVSPLMMQSTSLLLRSRLAIDPILTPMTFSITTFCTSTVELFVKLPIETVLRRGQMSVVSSSKYVGGGKGLEGIVDVGPYRGTLATMWLIAQEEGVSLGEENGTGKAGAQGVKSGRLGERKGQGIEGLWRGWRVGIWGLVGIWGAAALGGAANSGGEF
jgi:mitochondrial fusion and transport protein UGO1